MSCVPNILLAFALLLVMQVAAGQEAERSELRRVERAFATGDVDALAAMSTDRVEIAVFGLSRLYSRSQARFILRDLFAQYPPQHFELSTPSRTDKGLFAAGTYRYSVEEKPLRVYIRLRKSGDAWALREILVDKADQ